MPVLPGRGTFRHQRLSAYKCLGEFRQLNPGDSPSVSARPSGGRPSSAQSLSLPGVRRNEGFQHGLAHEVGRQQPLSKDEIVELLLVEFRPERCLNLPP